MCRRPGRASSPTTQPARWSLKSFGYIGNSGQAAECVGVHAERNASRFQALEPLRQGLRRRFGGFARDIARGLAVRHDHGSQYMSDHFQKEIAFLGIASSPAFVRAPEGSGCAERFIRTLKENLLWVRTFETIEDLRIALLEFRDTYNTTWLIQRHRYLTPEAFRQSRLQSRSDRRAGFNPVSQNRERYTTIRRTALDVRKA